MEIITIESVVFSQIMEKLQKIEEYVKTSYQKSLYEQTKEKWLTKSEVLNMLGISERTLQRLRIKGELKYVVLSKKKIRYRLKDVENYIQSKIYYSEPQTLNEIKKNFSLKNNVKQCSQ